MNKPHDKHSHGQKPQQDGLHKDWRTWVVVLLMLGAMLIYILSDNESLQPGGGEQTPVPAAP